MEPSWEKIAAFNVELGEREFQKDGKFFEAHLAAAFAMQRANPERTVIDRARFLEDLAKSTPKAHTTQVHSICLIGTERLAVTCVVTVDGQRFHNLRIFVPNRKPRQSEADPEWLLLAWANEPID